MKNNNLVKILTVIVVVLALGFLTVSARLISLKNEAIPNPPIIENNNDEVEKPSVPNKPEEVIPPKDSAPSAEDEIITTKYISKDQAIEIAIAKVGEGTKVIEVDEDLEDNPPKYEIELTLGAYEYEVEIHAITGAIIDFDKDDLD